MKIKGIVYLVKIFRVPSRSEKGVYYLVELYSDNSLECDCWAGTTKKECWHKIKVRDYLNQQKYKINYL